MKEINRKGFTLAELLIVVAIIAVLVAIAIPVFSGRLEKAREATCMANRRSLYGQVVTEHIVSDVPYSELFNIYVGSAGKCPSGGVFSWEDQGDTGVVICSYHDGGGGGSGSGSGSSSALHTTSTVRDGLNRGDVISDETGTCVIKSGKWATYQAVLKNTKVSELISSYGDDAIRLNASDIKDASRRDELQANDVFYDKSTGFYYWVTEYHPNDPDLPNGAWQKLNQ